MAREILLGPNTIWKQPLFWWELLKSQFILHKKTALTIKKLVTKIGLRALQDFVYTPFPKNTPLACIYKNI